MAPEYSTGVITKPGDVFSNADFGAFYAEDLAEAGLESDKDESLWSKALGMGKTVVMHAQGQAYALSGAPFVWGAVSVREGDQPDLPREPKTPKTFDELSPMRKAVLGVAAFSGMLPGGLVDKVSGMDPADYLTTPDPEFAKMPWWQQALVATGAGMVSMYEAITDPRSFGKSWDGYYESVTGQDPQDDFTKALAKAGVPDPVTLSNQLWPLMSTLIEAGADPTLALGGAASIARLRTKGFVGQFNTEILDAIEKVDMAVRRDERARRAVEAQLKEKISLLRKKEEFDKGIDSYQQWREEQVRQMRAEVDGGDPLGHWADRSGGRYVDDGEEGVEIIIKPDTGPTPSRIVEPEDTRARVISERPPAVTHLPPRLSREPGQVISGTPPPSTSQPPNIDPWVKKAKELTVTRYEELANKAKGKGVDAFGFVNSVRRDLGLPMYVGRAVRYSNALEEVSRFMRGGGTTMPSPRQLHMPEELAEAMERVFGKAEAREAIDNYLVSKGYEFSPNSVGKSAAEFVEQLKAGSEIEGVGTVVTLEKHLSGNVTATVKTPSGKMKQMTINQLADAKRAAEPSVTTDFLGLSQTWDAVHGFFAKYKSRRSPFTYDPVVDPMTSADAMQVIKQRETKDAGHKVVTPGVLGCERNVMLNVVEPESSVLQPKFFKGEWWDNAVRIFDQLDPSGQLKKMWFWPVVNADNMIARENKMWYVMLKRFKKELSPEEARQMMIYAVSRQKSGVDRLAKVGVTEDQIPELSELPKHVQSVYEELRKVYEMMFQRVNNARIQSGKAPIPYVENYFTFVNDVNEMAKAKISLAATPLTAIQRYLHPIVTRFPFVNRATGKGRAKRLAQYGVDELPIELDPLKAFSKYMNYAVEHVHKSPITAKLNELLGEFKFAGPDGKVIDWSLSHTHPHAARFLREWLDFQVGVTVRWFFQDTILDRGLDVLTSNLTFAVLGGSVRSALIQPTALKNTFTMLGPRSLVRGIKAFMSAEKRTGAILKSKVLYDRMPETALIDAIDGMTSASYGGRAAAKYQQARKGSLYFLQLLDSWSAEATWLGAYHHAKRLSKEGQTARTAWAGVLKTEDDFIRFADDVVLKTQASGSRAVRSKVQRHVMGRAATLFQTFVINDLNFVIKDVFGVGGRSKLTTGEKGLRLMRLLVGSALINMFYEDVLKMNSPLPTPVRSFYEAYQAGSENPTLDGTKAAGMEIVSMFPIIGSMRYGTGLGGAVYESVTRLFGLDKYGNGIDWSELPKLGGVAGYEQLRRIAREHFKRGENWWAAVAGKRQIEGIGGQSGGFGGGFGEGFGGGFDEGFD